MQLTYYTNMRLVATQNSFELLRGYAQWGGDRSHSSPRCRRLWVCICIKKMQGTFSHGLTGRINHGPKAKSLVGSRAEDGSARADPVQVRPSAGSALRSKFRYLPDPFVKISNSTKTSIALYDLLKLLTHYSQTSAKFNEPAIFCELSARTLYTDSLINISLCTRPGPIRSDPARPGPSLSYIGPLVVYDRLSRPAKAALLSPLVRGNKGAKSP
jgi:hypothetical protein